MNRKLTARLVYEQYDESNGQLLDRVERRWYNHNEGSIKEFITEMYFFVRKCMVGCDDHWGKYFWLPGDDHVNMILDTSINTTKEHLDEAEKRIKHARKVMRSRK